jgi:hypothetical protein
VAQLRFQANTSNLTFTVAANHLTAAVSQTPDYLMARKLSSTNSYRDQRGGRISGRGGGRFTRGGGRGGRGGRGRGRFTKTKYNDYLPKSEWDKLSAEERDNIRKARDKDKGQSDASKRSIGEISVAQLSTIIGAMQSAAQSVAPPATAISEITIETPNQQAGNAFGGREGAAQKKSRS